MEIDLNGELPLDTYLTVKFGDVFVHYIIPVIRKDGTKRCYGDLFTHFTNRDKFRFAIGYVLTESEQGDYWQADMQYFYFDKKKIVQMAKRLNTPLVQFK